MKEAERAGEAAKSWSARGWLLMAAATTVVASFFAAQKLVGAIVRGRPPPWIETIWTELYYWYLLAAFLPLAVWLARRVRIRRTGAVKASVTHSMAAVLIGIVHSILYYPVLALALGDDPIPAAVARELPTAVMTVFWKYWVVIGVYYAFDYHRKYLERQEHAAALEQNLVEARLEALQMQLHPHFLFNTLHTVSMLNLEDPRAANRVLSRLGELLRMALEDQSRQEVPLAREMEFIRRYLEIEAARFERRLRPEIDVPADLFDACVPNLILQPLVENAVRHGLTPRAEPGRITVSARRTGDTLTLEVSDDGPGLDAEGRVHGQGIGLQNTRKRLATLYGNDGQLRLESSSGGGLRAVVRLPYRKRSCGESASKP